MSGRQGEERRRGRGRAWLVGGARMGRARRRVGGRVGLSAGLGRVWIVGREGMVRVVGWARHGADGRRGWGRHGTSERHGTDCRVGRARRGSSGGLGLVRHGSSARDGAERRHGVAWPGPESPPGTVRTVGGGGCGSSVGAGMVSRPAEDGSVGAVRRGTEGLVGMGWSGAVRRVGARSGMVRTVRLAWVGSSERHELGRVVGGGGSGLACRSGARMG